MVGQWAPIHYCSIEESKGENELFYLHKTGLIYYAFRKIQGSDVARVEVKTERELHWIYLDSRGEI